MDGGQGQVFVAGAIAGVGCNNLNFGGHQLGDRGRRIRAGARPLEQVWAGDGISPTPVPEGQGPFFFKQWGWDEQEESRLGASEVRTWDEMPVGI